MSWIHGAITRARLLAGRRATDSRMNREFAFHVDMEAQRLMREEQLMPDEARRRALVAFGPAESHREALRDGRGVSWFSGLALDLRLGVRVLRKYPGLTIVGVVGMGMAVAIATFMFTMVELAMRPVLPLPGGERIVGIRAWDLRERAAANATPHDYATLRATLETMESVGAFRMAERNLILADSSGGEVFTAEMTASAFTVTGVAPLLGRVFTEAEEVAGDARVLVISHELWRTRFQSSPSILGVTVRLGGESHAIVGVMPDGYAFPVSQDVWQPLRLGPSQFAPGTGGGVAIVGRLAPGMTIEAAQAEVSTIGRRLVAEQPVLRADQELQIVNVPRLLGMGIASEDENLSFLPLVFPLILVLVCVNVATLVYARTAARHTEIAVRASLGASRGRIIGQLFAEALVLSCAGSLLGLMVSRIAFGLVSSTFTAGGARMPFWLRPEITPGLVAYIVVLTLLAAFIVGVLPARSASLHGVRATLAQLAASDSVRLGRAWSVLIIAQVGVAVAVLPAIVSISAVYGYYSLRSPGFPTEQVLTATIEFDPSAQGLTNNGRLALLEQRLEAEPGFKDVTFATGVVGQELFSRFEFDDEVSDSLPRRSPQLRALAIAPDFMTQFGVALRAGRSFSSGDFRSGARTVVVNEEFVREFFEGRNVIGFRVRHYSQGNNRSVAGRVDSDSGPASGSRGSSAEADGEWGWMEIVGVVANFPPNRMNPEASESRVYEPMREGERHPVVMMHANTSAPPGSLSTLVTRIGLALDPGLRINRVLPLDVVYREGARGSARLASLMMALVTVCVLVLSGAGMSSLLSFTVTRRTREIGIRSALGADPGRILLSIFGRVLAQLGAGSAVGLFLAWSLNQGTSGELLGESGGLVVAGVVLLVSVAGFLAAWGPARRGLRIQPADALRSE